jgi:hypothetical protein
MKWNQFEIQGRNEINWNTLFIGKDGLMKMILGSQKEIYLMLRKVSMTFMPYIQRLLVLRFFPYPSTSSHTPSLFPSSTSTNTHTHSQVIGHSHTCHITHHTLSHHSLHHHDITHDSHSLSMTSSKIQTRPTSNSVINRDLISNHPLSLIKILIRSNPHQLR